MRRAAPLLFALTFAPLLLGGRRGDSCPGATLVNLPPPPPGCAWDCDEEGNATTICDGCEG